MAKPTSPATPVDWMHLRDLLSEAFDRLRLFYHPDTKERQSATLTLMSIASGLREYVLALPEDLKEVWGILRANQQTLDLLLGVTSEMVLLSGYSVPELASHYAQAVHAAIPRHTVNGVATLLKEGVSDPIFLESVAMEEELQQLLIANPWLLTLLLLKQSGQLNLVKPLANPAPSPEESP